MRVKLLLILIFILKISQNSDLAVTVRKFVNQKDMSEYCKRRVIPSVFLGKQVMDASSHVMQFSRLDMPYSCSLSVRSETGYSIILIIHLLSVKGLQEACSQNEDQLIIYELGETFGGYWGHLPNDIITKKIKRNYTKFYTIKTTQPTATTRTQISSNNTEKILMQTFPATDKEPDYIRMEVPLVNVSGNLQLGGSLTHTYDSEELFDFIYDVTPRNESQYETSVMPLVQFSIRQQEGGNVDKSLYELDYDVKDFTVDSRLIYSTKHSMTTRKYKWLANKRYTFRKKNKHPFFKKDIALLSTKFFTPWSDYLSSEHVQATKIQTLEPLYLTFPWKNVDDFIKNIYVTPASTPAQNNTIRRILNNISNMQHNLSIYLNDNLSIFNNDYTAFKEKTHSSSINDPNTVFTTKSFVKSFLSPATLLKYESTVAMSLEGLSSKSIYNNNDTTAFFIKINSTQDYSATESLLHKTDVLTTFDYTSHTQERQNGILVNHESWENVVQSAPVMAIILNKTKLGSRDSHKITMSNFNKSNTHKPRKLRKRRNVQAVQIENSRPRSMSTKKNIVTDEENFDEFSEMQDFARLIELQDDEIASRVALRYLRNYVGPVLFNICDYEEAESRQMFLFNTSRMVISISNFTLSRMMLVLTPAVTLSENASQCPPAHLECQITGTRVCIDTLNACDGVPNCGSFDIYDEDRLLCGATKGLQHNVYMAAFTFLMVILTMLYTVHYWLKRCVPKVSEAFFVFSDTTENTLLLDTIMRSPTDTDDYSYKCVYSSAFFDNVPLPEYKEYVEKSNIFKKVFNVCCGLLCCNKINKKDQSLEVPEKYDTNFGQSKKISSFTELELRKFTMSFKEEGVQTGDSIDKVKVKNKVIENVVRENKQEKDSWLAFEGSQKITDKKYTNELNLIKLSKEKKSSITLLSGTLNANYNKYKRRDAICPDDEKEIKNTIFEPASSVSLVSNKILTTCEIHSEKSKKIDSLKRLRFDESPTLIASEAYKDDVLEVTSSAHGAGPSKRDLNPVYGIEEGSISKELKKILNIKTKKQKK